jgi:hypothetical protein
VTQLRKMMLEELQRRNYSQTTVKGYLKIVESFAKHFHCSPDQLGPEQIRGDHGDGIAQHEAKGRGASSAECKADSDFAGAARHDERHHTIKADQRKQQRQGAEAAGERGEYALGIEGAVDLLVEGADPEDWQPRVVLAD